MTAFNRRGFLTAAGGAVAALSGCVSTGFPGSQRGFDTTVYVGSYHWGFVLFDDAGTELDRAVFDRGDDVEIVAFNTSAEAALDGLPSAVRGAVPGHEALEERNEERVPAPPNGEMHDVLEAANERYPDHSLGVMSSRQTMGHMGDMMLRPIPLPADATSTTTAQISASDPGDYTLFCHRECGYGHNYMYIDGGFVVQ